MDNKLRRATILSLLLTVLALEAWAQQLTGVVIDAETGDSIPYASVTYRGHHYAVVSDGVGRFSIGLHKGWNLTISAVGYKSKVYAVSDHTLKHIVVKLKSDSKNLDEVIVKAKKSKYSRKNNPAVELMQRVIAAKQQTKLENKPYFQYRNYERMTIALNEITEKQMTTGAYGKKEWLKNQLEVNPVTGKHVLPVITSEKVFHRYYRKEPEKERIYVDAEQSKGINDLIETGDLFTALAKEVFTEVDIYDDQVRLLQYPFTSPIGRDAIGFYRFYIVDTVQVERDSCIQVSFVPNNQQDFGFRGDIWILKDSTLHVRKVHLSIPKRSDVNFVRTMSIDQEYLKLESGDWVLNVNDMIVEMSLVGQSGNFLVTRTSRRNDYSFDPIDDKIFRGKALEKRDPYSEMRDKDYWEFNREVELTHGEAGMDDFLNGMRSSKGFGWLMIGVKTVMENFVETTKGENPSKVDIGPVNSMVSSNDIDGFRLRFSAQTTANLNPHLFVKGYAAHGFRSKNNYYGGTVTYSFNKKAYSPDEFPMRNISFSSSYDICSPSDKFLNVDKDNVFTALKWTKVMNQAFYNRQTITFVREEDWGFGIDGGLKFEEDEAAGHLYFKRFGETLGYGEHGKLRFTELHLQLTFSPGQTYVNSKQKRSTVNRDAPIFKLKHTVGIKGLMGGQYNYHVTEGSIYYRQWLKTWGKMDVRLKGGLQWNQVPFPLLIAPAANVSYIQQRETFALVNNMEFLNDRYVSLQVEWDLNGKILNRIPLLQRLQWRELIGFNVLWGGLSDKNNPFLAQNTTSRKLMEFPECASIMDPHKPYAEFRAGIHNILKMLEVEYVYRFNYLDLPTATKHGVRFGFRATF